MFTLNLKDPIPIPTIIPEMDRINHMELSPNQKILYIVGKLTSNKARKSCPVLALDAQSGDVKSMLFIMVIYLCVSYMSVLELNFKKFLRLTTHTGLLLSREFQMIKSKLLL